MHGMTLIDLFSDQKCLAKYFRHYHRNVNKYWDDATCTTKKQFICSYDPVFDCPQGWQKYKDNCYFTANILTTWSHARDMCKVKFGPCFMSDNECH